MAVPIPAAPKEQGGAKVIFLVYDAGGGDNGAAFLRAVAKATLNGTAVASMGVATHADGEAFDASDPVVVFGGVDAASGFARKVLVDSTGRQIGSPILTYDDGGGTPTAAAPRVLAQGAIGAAPVGHMAVGTHVQAGAVGGTDPLAVIAGVFSGNAKAIAADTAGRMLTKNDVVFGGTGHMNVSGGTRQQLKSTTTCRLLKIKADPGNAQVVYIGSVTVTADETAATGGYQLSAGQEMEMWTTDVANIYVHGANLDGVSFAWFV